MWWTAAFETQWVVALIPQRSSTPWETILDLVDADAVARDPAELIPASRSDESVPLVWLPYLAEERSVDEFDSGWPETRQRSVTRASMGVHQIKGTRPVMDRAMAPMEFVVKVVEWFEVTPRRQANTFRLSLTIEGDRTWTIDDAASLIRTANKTKNAHTKLEAIELRRNVPGTIYVGGLFRRVERIRIGQLPDLETIRISGSVYVGAAVRVIQTLRVRPRS